MVLRAISDTKLYSSVFIQHEIFNCKKVCFLCLSSAWKERNLERKLIQIYFHIIKTDKTSSAMKEQAKSTNGSLLLSLNKLTDSIRTATLVHLVFNTDNQICLLSELFPLRILPRTTTLSISLRVRNTLPACRCHLLGPYHGSDSQPSCVCRVCPGPSFPTNEF